MRKYKVLIVTSSYDKTCDYIISKYSSINFFRLDVDRFSDYLIDFSSKGFTIEKNKEVINSNSCLSIYLRKPSMENLDGKIEEEYQTYVHKETYSLIEGIIECFDGTVLTKPSIMRKANNKAFQAYLATKCDLTMPIYAITNSQKSLDFFSRRKGIIKPIATGEILRKSHKEFIQTNLIDKSFDTKSFKYSPVYLQDFIDKDYEIRITIVGKCIYPVKIQSENNIDWRKPMNKVSYAISTVPPDIENKCLVFMKYCNMHFGCFDFIVKDDVWYFLEMNANGQWAWLEFETGINISEKIIGLLTNKNI